eukprot:CAMPEP_0202895272 /NCGR_PEP_ID=MMETSP1392-20130828/4520_1 /ASSEMBLY_ACC=CAM_ASM_000868 /TAXON_ID=225041 /ORGANISM="Chlamydomonas chlamydogama, Strain SAG 11-48b" /LENGTH=108 /DNA_ID=CAMNT_0049580229 /DNA_START=161 /DNA_END=487 /DNA_ORIENTATION=-
MHQSSKCQRTRPLRISSQPSDDIANPGVPGVESLLTREKKIREVAEVLGTNRDVVERIISLRPGIMLVPDVPTFFRSRIYAISLKYKVPQNEARRMIVANPTIVFDQS